MDIRILNISKEIAGIVNSIKSTMPDFFLATELRTKLIEHKCPYSGYVVSWLKQAECLTKNGKLHSFTIKDPIPYTAYTEGLTSVAKYWRSKNNKKEQSEISTKSMLTIESAIQFLKDNGYKIYRETITLEEV